MENIEFENGDSAILIKSDGRIILYNTCNESEENDLADETFKLALALAETVNNNELLKDIYDNLEEMSSIFETEEDDDEEEGENYIEFIPEFELDDVFFSNTPKNEELN